METPTINKTNIIHRANGIITYTVEITWLRDMDCGWGNGYLGVPLGHPLYGIHYDDINNVDAHGGLTYSEEIEIEGSKYWVIGFDTAHYNDNKSNRPESYIINEVEEMYRQVTEHY